MSKVTRSKLKFLIYILLQETNKINRKFFQILNDFFRTHSSASRVFVTRKRFSACCGNSPIPLEHCLRHRAAASPFHSGPRKTDVHRTSCARSGRFNGSSCQRKRRSESSPRLQKHLLVLAASTLFIVLVYTLFPVCAQRGTAPDRADCFADHFIIRCV